MPNDMSPLLGHDTFSLTSFLEGRTRAWGVFEDRFGRVKRRFEVELRVFDEGLGFRRILYVSDIAFFFLEPEQVLKDP